MDYLYLPLLVKFLIGTAEAQSCLSLYVCDCDLQSICSTSEAQKDETETKGPAPSIPRKASRPVFSYHK